MAKSALIITLTMNGNEDVILTPQVWEVTEERVNALKRVLGGPHDSPISIFDAEDIVRAMLDEVNEP